MLLLLPLVLGFVFMVTAWTYCLRGWLGALMVNPRRRRSIIVGLTTAFILLAQLPNLYFNVYLRLKPDGKRAEPALDAGETVEAAGRSRRRDAIRAMLQSPASVAAHHLLPPLWVGSGASNLAGGNPWPALWGSVCAAALGNLALRRAYKTTWRFYLGGAETGGSAIRNSRLTAKRVKRESLLEARLPGVPEEAAAIAVATLRSLLRAPEVKMSLATPFVMTLVLGGLLLLGRSTLELPRAAGPFLMLGVMVFAMTSLLALIFNQFGFDRDAFRTLALSPVRRSHILLGKNLALLPIALGVGFAFVGVVQFRIRLPIPDFLAAALQLLSLFLIVCTGGNLASVMLPYRVAPGSMRATKTSAKTSLLVFLWHLFFPIAVLPLFGPPLVQLLVGGGAWAALVPVNLILSVMLACVAAVGYRACLGQVGRLLQKREPAILQAVTQEIE